MKNYEAYDGAPERHRKPPRPDPQVTGWGEEVGINSAKSILSALMPHCGIRAIRWQVGRHRWRLSVTLGLTSLNQPHLGTYCSAMCLNFLQLNNCQSGFCLHTFSFFLSVFHYIGHTIIIAATIDVVLPTCPATN